jgi:hypothetical protein
MTMSVDLPARGRLRGAESYAKVSAIGIRR